jgi:hypothetical protein
MTIRFGVNYLPRRDWWYAWGEDDDAFAEDFEAIARLGFDHVRIQCLWPVFQPNPAWVSPHALRRLVRLLDDAADQGLSVCVTVLDGWLSGFDFRPVWLTGDPFASQAATDAAALLVETVADAVAGHPALWCLDVANEPNVLMNATRPGYAEPWAERMLAAARRAGVPVTIGVDHAPWMTVDGPLRAEFLTSSCDLVAVHAWPLFTGVLERMGEDRAWAVPDFLAQLARSAGSQTRPLWIQELGVSELWLTDTSVEDFAERMLRRAAAVPGVAAVTWWASHDIDRRFTGFDPLEYGLGLIDSDGRVKPVGRRLSGTIEELRRSPEPTAPTSGAGPEPVPLLLPSGAAADLDVAEVWFARMDPVAGPPIERVS